MPQIQLSAADRQRITEAIRAAEQGHRGEIVVRVEPVCYREPLRRAAHLFHKLGVDRTKEGTGVLLYVATVSRRAAVWAGNGVTGGAELATWAPVFAALEGARTRHDPVFAICEAIAALGRVLTVRAAGADRHGNELGDGATT